MVSIGGIGLFVVGKPAIGIVTVLVLTVTAGQMLIFGVLVRRHVEFDLKTWSRQASPLHRGLALVLGLFYAACYVWASFPTTKFAEMVRSTIAGMVTGAAVAIALALA